MDEQAKIKLRNRARIFHWVTQVVLALGLLFALTDGMVGGWVGKQFGRHEMLHTDQAVMDAFYRFQGDRLRDLVNLQIPTGKDAQSDWAHQIQERLDQPVAVFIKDDNAIHWLSIPEKLFSQTEHAPDLFDANVSGSELGYTDTIGTMIYRRAFLGNDSLGASVRIYGTVNDNKRWGILYKWHDVWAPFLRSLSRAKLGVQLEPAGRLLNNEVQLTAPLDDVTDKIGMRGYVDDELLLSTPNLDTTHLSYTWGFGGARLEYYLSDQDQGWANLIGGKKNPWVAIIVFAALMFVLYRFNVWIKQLTAEL